jgi:hypothetical protein
MALSTYSDLQTSISNFLHRADLASVIPDFIALAEADIYRRLRVSAMENSGSTTLSAETLALPTGFRELREIYIDTNPRVDLAFMPAMKMDQLYGGVSGTPRFYCVVGNTFKFAPVPDSSYTIDYVYYAAFDPLSTTSTNWLLTNHPDIFLYGSLMQSAPYIQNDERLKVWSALYEKGLEKAYIEDQKKIYSGPMEMRSDVYASDVSYR